MQPSRYRILGQIGQGQFGKVFCAVDLESGEVFALKDLEMKHFSTHKFLRELSYLVSLKHLNIVSFYGLEHHQSGRYLVMDYCEGGTLRELMESGQQLTLQLILKLIQDILSALVHAHRNKIIHCDIKPENILLKITPTGYLAKLSDFGIAKWTEELLQPSQTGGYTGSPAYMAPERFYGKYSAASDLYAVGILLYELLVGSRPFSGFPKDLMIAHLSKTFDLSDSIPPVLQSIIEKALRKLPQRRFKNSQEMLDAVQSAEQELFNYSLSEQIFRSAVISSLNKTLSIIEQVYLSSKIQNLAVLEEGIYWVEKNQLKVQNYDDKLFFLDDYKISFDDKIIKLEVVDNSVYIYTFSEKLKLYTLYYFCVKKDQLNKLLTWSANQLISCIEPMEKWIAIAVTSNQIVIYSLPNFEFIKYLTIQGEIKEIIYFEDIDSLLINKIENESTVLEIFNFLGGSYNVYSIPLNLELVTLSKSTLYEIFAIEENSCYLGLLIHLKPLKISRIVLPFKPNFVFAQDWGYILASTLGKVVLLDAKGQITGQINLSAKITAMTVLKDEQILVAVEINHQNLLYLLKIESNFCQKSIIKSMTKLS
ncbi:serine/threonine-protein kinase [Chroococcus sp. FPU101]|uniref:serine/threonine-protein kinase n=1 Tax=Chroococcus sp. FPU101 TaxID=1974212 RepID=UPI001A8DB372|nr:serine/threonine-protein kinase [Chroococcus sp. FPU101]GFE71183.1 serine/threonine protein kinase [Chroococcus sp. FPU101]